MPKPPPIRARVRRCCASRRSVHESDRRARDFGAAAGGDGQRDRGGVGSPPGPRVFRRTDAAAEPARCAERGIRPAGTGAGDLGRARARRADRAQPARHDHPGARAGGDGPPMNPRAPTPPPLTSRRPPAPNPRKRLLLVLSILVLAATGLVARAIDLQVIRKQFYQDQGDARFLREVPIPVSRGTIFDRNGVPLAVSTPVVSIWANPSELLDNADQIPKLAKALDVDAGDLAKRLQERNDREFVYLRRQMSPEAAHDVLALNIPGVNGQREYKRYYPSGEVTAHVLGFTNIDDRGQEGLELAYDSWLAGKPGLKRVIRDRLGRTVEDVEQIRAPVPGHDLVLSIDSRIQYLAYTRSEERRVGKEGGARCA